MSYRILDLENMGEEDFISYFDGITEDQAENSNVGSDSDPNDDLPLHALVTVNITRRTHRADPKDSVPQEHQGLNVFQPGTSQAGSSSSLSRSSTPNTPARRGIRSRGMTSGRRRGSGPRTRGGVVGRGRRSKIRARGGRS